MQASISRTISTAATAIPAMAPVEIFLLLPLPLPDEELELGELPVDVEVGMTDGMAITSASTPFSKTHCETLNVRLL